MKACPVCGRGKRKTVYSSANWHGRHLLEPAVTFQIGVCEECGLLGPEDVVADRDYYQTFYPQGYHEDAASQGLLSRMWETFARHLLRNKIKTLRGFAPRKDRRLKLLDIGCGPGHFLSKLDRSVFEPHGLEPVGEAVAAAKKSGLDVVQGDVLLTPLGDAQYDIVTLWHVLEHIDQPGQALKRIHAALAPGGVLLITTPNTASFACSQGKEFWFHLDAPRHLHLFNDRNLTRLLEATGFDVVYRAHLPFDFPLDLFWSVRRNWLLCPLVALFYPVLKRFDCENMMVIARKRVC